jgi:hypothetical protein
MRGNGALTPAQVQQANRQAEDLRMALAEDRLIRTGQQPEIFTPGDLWDWRRQRGIS